MFIVWDAIKIARKGTDLIPIFQGREEIVENSFRSLWLSFHRLMPGLY